MNPELEELYQAVILDHSRRPRNFGELRDAAVLIHGDNPVCGDEIHLGVKFDTDGGLQDIRFTGHGCAISQASASLMTMKLKGKSRAQATEMFRAFHDLVTDERADAPKMLGDLQVMQGVRKFPQRVKCAMLPWRAVEQALQQDKGESTISTKPILFRRNKAAAWATRSQRFRHDLWVFETAPSPAAEGETISGGLAADHYPQCSNLRATSTPGSDRAVGSCSSLSGRKAFRGMRRS